VRNYGALLVMRRLADADRSKRAAHGGLQHNPVPCHHFTYNSFSQFRDAYTLDQRVATP